MKPGSTKYNDIVFNIYEEHKRAIRLKSNHLAESLEHEIHAECEQLKTFLAQLSQHQELSPEEEDRIVSVGEKLSARFLTAVLEDHGVQSQYLDLSDISHSKSLQVDQDFYHELAQMIGKKIRSCGDKAPILTGFFGKVPGGLLATCGRGYSDLCAGLAAVGSNARELQIWKEGNSNT